MSDFTYFILATIFNNFRTIVLIILMVVVWMNTVSACTVADDPIVINCTGCK